MCKKTLFLATILLSFTIISCTNHIVYQNNINIDNGWHKDSVKVFNVNISDTVQSYNVIIDLRHDNRYPYGNLWLFVRSVSPDSITLTDTINCILQGDDGHWIGSGFGSNYNIPFYYMPQINFSATGNHQFFIEQGMRDDVLEGITGVGLRIEKVNSQ